MEQIGEGIRVEQDGLCSSGVRFAGVWLVAAM